MELEHGATGNRTRASTVISSDVRCTVVVLACTSPPRRWGETNYRTLCCWPLVPFDGVKMQCRRRMFADLYHCDRPSIARLSSRASHMIEIGQRTAQPSFPMQSMRSLNNVA